LLRPRSGQAAATHGVAIPCWRRCCEAPAYPTVRSLVLRVKTQAPDPSERATTTFPRRFLLGGVALDTRSPVAVEAHTHVVPLALGLVDAGAAAPGGGCASRRRPRVPLRTEASWGRAVACNAWVTILSRQGGEVVGSVDVPQRRRFDVYVGAAAPDVGAAAVVCERCALCSLGCGLPSRAASWLRVRAAVCRDGGPGRWCWWSLRRAWWVSWMSGRRPRELDSVEDIDLVSRGRQGRFGAVL
jgi:hypothetical protein